MNKNRYSDIFVCNKHQYIDKHSRVNLEHIKDFYLNASLIKSIVDGKIFSIYAQAPLPKSN